MFTCLNDINATIKMTNAGEDSASSEVSHDFMHYNDST